MFTECFDTAFQEYTCSLASLNQSIGKHLRAKANEVANFLELAPELMFLAETLAKAS